MISVQEAFERLLFFPWKWDITHVPLWEAGGRILAKKVTADRDFPPFDRVMMDGVALRASDLQAGLTRFTIQETQYAGDPPTTLTGEATCIEIMTGAVCPNGADSIVPVEHYRVEGSTVVLETETAGMKHIHRQGIDRESGDLLLNSGQLLDPAAIGVLATVGVNLVPVRSLPRVAVISSGDELVPVETQPLAHQIRRSNVHMLEALCRKMGVVPMRFHISDGSAEEIAAELDSILRENDVLLLSGGVSKGKRDFVPEALDTLGMEKIFHRVRQRPGKPFWFGVMDKKRVFAFPGNPVSTAACAYRYFEPWLKKSLGQVIQPRQAALSERVSFPPKLTRLLPVIVVPEGDRRVAYPLAGQGSGDLANLADVNAFLELPNDREVFEAGDIFDLYEF